VDVGSSTAARRAALVALMRWDTTGHPLKECMTGWDDLDSRDRALAMELTHGTLRYLRRLRAELKPLLSKGLPGIRSSRWALLLGAYQLRYLQRVPRFAAVSTSVDLADRKHRKLVNAVLRKFADTPPIEPASLGVRYAFSDDFVEDLGAVIPGSEMDEALAAFNAVAPRTLRSRIPRSALLNRLQGLDVALETGRWSGGAVSVDAGAGDIRQWPGFVDGDFVVQDEAAQLVTDVLAPAPGMRVLDLGAAPGGKTFHCADRVGEDGEVVAVDVDRRRLSRLQEEAVRLGLTQVQSTPADATKAGNLPGTAFDRVLLDAPCSAWGIVRRVPDAKWKKLVPEELPGRQRQMLEAAASAVAPGGRLVYAVCTFRRQETDAVVESPLPGFRPIIPEVDPALLMGNHVRTFPHRHGTDAFFVAAWQRDT
jgi:16S rRNA (cytosine967-C5)-methyltransferase